MGELFRRVRPKTPLTWTGERLVSGVIGAIESEHLHRYFLARDFCRGKTVLDVASGEGYGAALLAQTAAQVTGVELDPESVEHASRNYDLDNLRYVQGDAIRLPLESASVDVVTSFETLEHFFDQELFLAEVRRILHPDGLLIISTPDAPLYSGPGSVPNPFHVRELSKPEFSMLLHQSFRNVTLYRQRAFFGSAVLPECVTASGSEPWCYEQRDSDTFEAHRCLPRAPYLLAFASDAPPPLMSTSIYVQAPFDPILELESLQKTVAAYRKQDPVIEQELAKAAGAHAEATRLAALVPQLEAEIERLKAIHEISHQQELAIAQERAMATAQLQESLRLQEEAIALRKALDEATEVNREKQVQLDASSLLLRQQTLFANRLQRQLTSEIQRSQGSSTALENAARLEALLTERNLLAEQVSKMEALTHERDALAAERDALAAALVRERQTSKELSELIIPVWIRKVVPAGLRPGLRYIKRAMHPKPEA